MKALSAFCIRTYPCTGNTLNDVELDAPLGGSYVPSIRIDHRAHTVGVNGTEGSGEEGKNE